MSEELQPTNDSDQDTKADAISVSLLILISVIAAIYWVSGQ